MNERNYPHAHHAHATILYNVAVYPVTQVEAGSGYSRLDKLSSSQQACEYLLMTMRTANGADLQKYASLSGERIPLEKLKNLRELNLIHIKRDRIFATNEGRLLLNSVILELLRQTNEVEM